MSTLTALYRHYNAKKELLYVGISLCPAKRLSQHQKGSPWFQDLCTVDVEWFPSRQSALLAEQYAIVNERPKHNVIHSENKEARAKQSEIALLQRVVFKPLYSMSEAAELLLTSTSKVAHLVDKGLLGCIDNMPSVNHKRPSRRITGWQLIDFLEHAQDAGTVSP